MERKKKGKGGRGRVEVPAAFYLDVLRRPHHLGDLRNPRVEGIIASCSHPAIHASADRQVVAPSPSRR